MKTKLERADVVTLALVAGTMAVTGALYARLPPRIPIHFDIHGVANGWAPRSIGAWLSPLVALLLWALLRPGARLLPPEWRTRMEKSPAALVAAFVAFLLCSIHLLILYAALEHAPSIGAALGILLGASWIALGLIMPRLRRNPWMGIRTPWTLSSDENWARTHRFAGYVFSIAGAVGLFGTLLTRSLALALTAIGASALAPAVYSFVLARRLPPET